jgi:hypothetical protein
VSVIAINEQHNLGILSRNFNGFRNGKIRAIIKPTIGILTNIGTDEGFANSQEK